MRAPTERSLVVEHAAIVGDLIGNTMPLSKPILGQEKRKVDKSAQASHQR